MDYITRLKYIEKIKQFADIPVIKVLTGMRRVGKINNSTNHKK